MRNCLLVEVGIFFLKTSIHIKYIQLQLSSFYVNCCFAGCTIPAHVHDEEDERRKGVVPLYFGSLNWYIDRERIELTD